MTMDVVGANQPRNSGKKPPKNQKKPAADVKVVYISSPMKVTTSASKFRALVQKLTGQDSDAERFMELIAANPHDDDQWWVESPDEDEMILRDFDGMFQNYDQLFDEGSGGVRFSGLEQVHQQKWPLI